MDILKPLQSFQIKSRPLGDYFKVQKLVSRLIRNREAFISRPKDEVYVDIGCGPNIRQNWFNIDWLWRIGVDACWDVTKGIPVDTGRALGCYSEHCFEHIEFDEFKSVTAEIHRILKKGSWVRIVVPDAQIYVELYAKHLSGNKISMPYQEGDVSRAKGTYSPVFSLNRIMHDHGHKFIYDFEIMKSVLENAGFSNVQKMAYQKTNDSRLAQDTEARAIESLYVEAQKL